MIRKIFLAFYFALAFAVPAWAQGAYEAAVADWFALQASQAQACAEHTAAKDVLIGRKARVAVLILHGFTHYPGKMDEYIKFFSRYDANILVPRLSHHFNQNLADLDKVSYADWVRQTEKSLAIARRLGHEVIVVGYSLGGLLASRLALSKPRGVQALVLLSPVWRMGTDTGTSAYVGKVFTAVTGYAPADLLSLKPTCATPKLYPTAMAGVEIAALIHSIEDKWGSGQLDDYSSSAFLKIPAPIFMAGVEHDTAIGSTALDELFMSFESGYHTRVMLAGKEHAQLVMPGIMNGVRSAQMVRLESPSNARTLGGQLRFFLKNVLGVTPVTRATPAR